MNSQDKAFFDHIDDIKSVILLSGGVWFVFSLVAGVFINPIQQVLFAPAQQSNLVLHFLSPMEALLFSIKISALAGCILALPFISFIVWNYIQNALMVKERKALFLYTIISTMLMVIAIIYSWFWLIPNSLSFLVSVTPENTEILLTITEYFNFIFMLTIAMISIFQIPTILFVLVKTGIVSYKTIADRRKELYMGIIIFTALVGSPDILSWILTTIPALILFETSLFIAKLTTERKKLSS